MRLRQLMEGQKEQIEGLRPSAPVALYHPSGVEEVASLLKPTGTEDQELLVLPSLKAATKLSDIVLQFYGRGKDLYPPRSVAKNRRDKALAAQKYPDSFRPEVSFSLLSQRPMAVFQGFLSPGNIEKVFVMRDGRPEAMDVGQFVEYFIKHRAELNRRKQSQVDIQYESTILRGL